MRRIVRAAATLLGLAAGICNPARADELNVGTPDGVRSAILLPAERPQVPTVIVLHGALVSAESTVGWYGFGGAAKRRGFAAVFPRGINLQWNDGRSAVWASGADDVDSCGAWPGSSWRAGRPIRRASTWSAYPTAA